MYSHYKKIIDHIFALIIIFLISPFLLIISLAILLTMGKPIIFSQTRSGFKGKSFILYKFRTMLIKKDSKGKLVSDTERRCKFGDFLRRYSIDELPELINIIKGEMSFVGPRPLLIEYMPLYKDYQLFRFNVKPGLTGWAQINGRNLLSWEQKFKLDIWYVENISLFLDFFILIKTIKQIIFPSGIDSTSNNTMPFFDGDN